MTCKHLKARLDSDSLTSAIACPDCGKTVRIYQLVNNMLDAMQRAIGAWSAVPQPRGVGKAIKGRVSEVKETAVEAEPDEGEG